MTQPKAIGKQTEWINVWGARVHNLKNVDVKIPRNALTVITGLSGSGKSSLAFDTIYAEGQRRYIETFSAYAGHAIYILAPLVRQRKGHYRELFESMRKKGYLYIRVDGEIKEITRGMKVDRYKNHNIEVVIDKLKVRDKDDERLKNTVRIAMRQGDGVVMVMDRDTGEAKNFSKRLMDPVTGLAYSDPAPNIFSFNSPEGACPHCKGLGYVNEIDLKKVIPNDALSIHDGAIVPLGKYKSQMIFWQIDALLKKYDCSLKTPFKDIPADAVSEILYGSLENIRIDKDVIHTSSDYFVAFDGVIKYLKTVMENDDSAASQKWAAQFLAEAVCPEC